MDELSSLIVAHQAEYKYPSFRIEVSDSGGELEFGNGLCGTFSPNSECTGAALDAYHFELLHHQDEHMNLAGLASVIYWGYATSGDNYARNRVRWFLHGHAAVKPATSRDAADCLAGARNAVERRGYGDALGCIGAMGQLSRTPFASKVIAFLAPNDAGVYDNKISDGLGDHPILSKAKILQECLHGVGPVTSLQTRTRYDAWCVALQAIAAKINDSGRQLALRALDVERGIFAAIVAFNEKRRYASK